MILKMSRKIKSNLTTFNYSQSNLENTNLERYKAVAASPTCKDAAIALTTPINRLKFVPKKVAKGARGRKEGRQVVGQRNELKVR